MFEKHLNIPWDNFGKFDFISWRRPETLLRFVCSTSPQKVFGLAKELAKLGAMTMKEVSRRKKRNAAFDLLGLDLAYRRYKTLFPTDVLIKAYNESEDKILDTISSKALSSNFLKELLPLIKSNINASISKVGIELSKKFNKNWSESSAVRYASAGRLWLRFFGCI